MATGRTRASNLSDQSAEGEILQSHLRKVPVERTFAMEATSSAGSLPFFKRPGLE